MSDPEQTAGAVPDPAEIEALARRVLSGEAVAIREMPQYHAVLAFLREYMGVPPQEPIPIPGVPAPVTGPHWLVPPPVPPPIHVSTDPGPAIFSDDEISALITEGLLVQPGHWPHAGYPDPFTATTRGDMADAIAYASGLVGDGIGYDPVPRFDPAWLEALARALLPILNRLHAERAE
jgi:hypothetical protein